MTVGESLSVVAEYLSIRGGLRFAVSTRHWWLWMDVTRKYAIYGRAVVDNDVTSDEWPTRNNGGHVDSLQMAVFRFIVVLEKFYFGVWMLVKPSRI